MTEITKTNLADLKLLCTDGVTVLKFGRRGNPKEKNLKLSGNMRYLKYTTGIFSFKFTKNKIDFEKVIRIQRGQQTVNFSRLNYKIAADRSLSIIYLNNKNQESTLDIITTTNEIFNYLFTAFSSLYAKIQDEKSKLSIDMLYLKSKWDVADDDNSGTLNTEEVINLISTMNINMSTKNLRKMFAKVDEDQNGTLNFEEFLNFMGLLRKRSDLELLWNSIFTGVFPDKFEPFNIINSPEVEASLTKSIGLDQLCKFWLDYQSEVVSKQQMVKKIVDVTHEAFKLDQQVSLSLFISLLEGASNSAYDPSKQVIYQDMSQPLSHYYMASSHNTYLEGDQLASSSSVKRYIDDFLSGCRCVELDAWDGDASHGYEPIIYHGFTLTTKILFRDVIVAIRDYGFETSVYPIVISLENHCNLDQQQKIATMLKSILGDALVLPTEESTKQLPLLKDLKNKILLKGKASAEEDIGEDGDDDNDDEEETVEKNSSGKSSSVKRSSVVEKSASKNDVEHGHHNVHPELSAITFLRTGKVKKFNDESLAFPANMMCSYSENLTLKHLKKDDVVEGWIQHNKNHLSRIYPKGTRVDSSNYNPTAAWAAGNQLVALNYQTGDAPKRINHGKFIENGSCGYVLKPQYMRDNISRKSSPISLIIHIIRGNQLPKPGGVSGGEIIDPFVIVEVNGHPADDSSQKTKTIQDNGFNPFFNEVFTFKITNPDVAIITFETRDEDFGSTEFVGSCSIPLSCLREGLRTVFLSDSLGKNELDFKFASLCVRIRKVPL